MEARRTAASCGREAFPRPDLLYLERENSISKGIYAPEIQFATPRRQFTTRALGSITIYLDDGIIERFKTLSGQTGKGYQTLINEALASYGANDAITAAQVRKIVREELAAKR